MERHIDPNCWFAHLVNFEIWFWFDCSDQTEQVWLWINCIQHSKWQKCISNSVNVISYRDTKWKLIKIPVVFGTHYRFEFRQLNAFEMIWNGIACAHLANLSIWITKKINVGETCVVLCVCVSACVCVLREA